MEVNQIMKGDFEHFMAKEIFEQPESLQGTMRGRIIPPTPAHPYGRIHLGGLVGFAKNITRSRRIILIGCGTSYHGCVAARTLFEEMTELPVRRPDEPSPGGLPHLRCINTPFPPVCIFALTSVLNEC